MKFICGEMPKPTGYDFTHYQKLQEPSQNIFHLVCMLGMLILWMGAFLSWSLVDNNIGSYFKKINFYELLLVLALVIPVHELLHAAFYPLRNHNCIVIGFWPKMGSFYATYTGKLSRNRWLVVYIAPFLIISVLPLIFAQTYVVPWLAVASIINAGLAIGDIAAVIMIILQVPSSAYIVQNGWDTYWNKEVDQ